MKLFALSTTILVLLFFSTDLVQGKFAIGGAAAWSNRMSGRKPWERTAADRWNSYKGRWEDKYEPWMPSRDEDDSGRPEPCVGLCYYNKLMKLEQKIKEKKREMLDRKRRNRPFDV